MPCLVGEDLEKEREETHSMMGLGRVEGVDEGAIAEAAAAAQDKTYSMDYELRTPAWSPRHPYHRLRAWVVEAASVLA